MCEIDKRYYINVKELMLRKFLPRPLPKNRVTVIVNDGEWLPIIDGDTGVCFK